MQTVSRFFWKELCGWGGGGGLDSQNIDQLCEFYTEFDSDTLWIQLSKLEESYHSFRQDEGDDALHNVVDILKKKKI